MPAGAKAAALEEAEEAEAAHAANTATGFTTRVHGKMCDELTSRLPRWLAGAGPVDRLVDLTVGLALERTFQHDRMNSAANYLFDQHLRSRRIARLPPGTRRLMLRKKEEILGALLAMDTDDDGQISASEFAAGVQALGLHLGREELHTLVECLDLDRDGIITARELSLTFFGADVTKEAAERAELRHAAASARRQIIRRSRSVRDEDEGAAGGGSGGSGGGGGSRGGRLIAGGMLAGLLLLTFLTEGR